MDIPELAFRVIQNMKGLGVSIIFLYALTMCHKKFFTFLKEKF